MTLRKEESRIDEDPGSFLFPFGEAKTSVEQEGVDKINWKVKPQLQKAAM